MLAWLSLLAASLLTGGARLGRGHLLGRWHSVSVDPDPLLSTTATAAAALVAIVGGLLVSRVVSLATERSGLEQRLADLLSQLGAAEKQRDELEARLLRWDVSDVLWEGREAFAKGDETYDVQAMIDEAGVDRSVEEVRHFVDQEAARYQSIRERLEPVFANGHPGFTFDEARENGLSVTRDEEGAYEAVWEALSEEHPEPRRAGYLGIDLDSLRSTSLHTTVVDTVRSAAAGAELASLRGDTESARHRVDALKVLVEQMELALAQVGRPHGVSRGLWVLGYVIVTGTFVPLGVMASGIESIDWRGASAVVALLASGIALLMGYIVVEVHRMTS